jgi:hypothetical protein
VTNIPAHRAKINGRIKLVFPIAPSNKNKLQAKLQGANHDKKASHSDIFCGSESQHCFLLIALYNKYIPKINNHHAAHSWI